MRLKTIMTTPVEVISPVASISTAERRLKLKGIHHLVVVEHGKVVGMVTTETLKSRRDEGAKQVVDAMIRNLAIATPEMTVREAADLMMPEHLQTAVPIVRNDRLVGIVSVSDLLELASR
jgi:IMP dehydrogenase